MAFSESMNVRIILSLRAAIALTERCDRGETVGGYRLGMQGGHYCCWPASAAPASPPAGGWRLRAHEPRENQATVFRLLWDVAAGGRERDVMEALTAGTGEALADEGARLW